MAASSQHDEAPRLSAGALRALRGLLKRKGREATGRFLVEGASAVQEAVAAGRAVRIVADQPERWLDLAGEVPLLMAAPAQIRELSNTVTPQGIMAECEAPVASWDDLSEPRLVVVCAQVRDPGNAGTIVRSADAFGADAVIFTSGSVELLNPKTVRATMGSLFHLPVLTGLDLAECIKVLSGRGLQILAAETEGDPLHGLASSGVLEAPSAWIMGNEAWGLEQPQLADRRVAVPMWGAAESLNLSIAAAVCLYQSAVCQHRAMQRRANVGPQ